MAESPLGVFASSLGYKATNDVSLGRIELRTRPGSVAHVLRNAILDGTLPGIVKLFENTCGSVDVSGLCGGT